MRVISGIAKGRRLASVPGTTTRPILDRVKTALFDTIRPRIQGVRMLDLFAGSGAVGIEALSQGASHCTFLDLSKEAIETIHANLKTTGFEPVSSVKHKDAFQFLRNTKDIFDLIYIAPPQYKGLWGEALRLIAERPTLLSATGEIIVQIDPKEREQLELATFKLHDERRHGNTLLLFYCHA